MKVETSNRPMSPNRRFELAVIGLALLLSLFGCSGSSTPSHSRPHVSSTPLWVATQSDQKVNSFAIDQTTGSISAVTGTANANSTGVQPSAIALSPDRLTLFVANSGDNTVGLYTVNSNGALIAAGIPVAGGSAPTAMAVDPAYTLLFVGDKGSDSIMVFSITPGLLTLKASFAVQTPAAPGGSGPVALALSPAGFSCIDSRKPTPVSQTCYALYSANQTSGTVTAYDYFVDSNGAFVRGSIDLNGNFIVGGTVTGSPYSIGGNPSSLAFSRCAGAGSVTTPCQSAGANGLLVASAGTNTVTVFSACIQLPTCHLGESGPDGTLSQLGSPFSTGAPPLALLLNRTADFVYVVNASQIASYTYDSASGALAPGGAINLSGGSVISGAITENAGGTAKNWIVVTSTSGLSTLGVASDGSLSSSSSGQTSLSGQPSAILID